MLNLSKFERTIGDPPELETPSNFSTANSGEGLAGQLPATSSSVKPDDNLIHYTLDSAAIVAMTDVRGTITYANSKFCEISGYSVDELIGTNHRLINSGTHDTAFFRAMYKQIARGSVWRGEICNRRKDGSLYWVFTTIVPQLSANGTIDGYASIRFDITERKMLEQELRASKQNLKRIASIDPQTGLPNRRGFQEQIESLVMEYGGAGCGFHLAFLDIDMFREINDSFGHAAGDDLLLTIAKRLVDLSGGRVLISRVGGDEFGLVFPDAARVDVSAFLENTLEVIRTPIPIAGTSRRCSASAGVAAFPRHGQDAASIFKAADLALSSAKALGRDRVEFFELKLREMAELKAELLAEIENGLHHDEFELHYQPIVSLASGHEVSFEALMRWRHPQRGLLTPEAFEEGFADQRVRAAFGMYMLEHVFRDLVRLRAEHVPLRSVAINLTNSDFRSDVFLDRFFELCEQTKLPPECFCVEVTEGMFLGLDQNRVAQGLQRLHSAGVAIALDDFGTGFASLTHLRQLPIDRLKIDRSFISNLVSSSKDQAIVRGVIEIAHHLGAIVTAEGIETDEQVELLADMGCDMLQGWYFGKACEPGRLYNTLKHIPLVHSHRLEH